MSFILAVEGTAMIKALALTRTMAGGLSKVLADVPLNGSQKEKVLSGNSEGSSEWDERARGKKL